MFFHGHVKDAAASTSPVDAAPVEAAKTKTPPPAGVAKTLTAAPKFSAVGGEDSRLHDFAGLKFHAGTGRDGHVYGGLIRVASGAGAAHDDVEHPKVAQLHASAPGQGSADVVQDALDDG